MTILLTNDDGIFAEGIMTLAKIVQGMGDIYVVAPSRQRSAASHGITVYEPLVVKEVEYPVLVKKAYSVSGKPADCVKVALEDLVDVKPDIILSGINAGCNFGIDVLYSGTVSAAMEGMLYGIPSFALSLDGINFDICNQYLKSLIERLMKHDIGEKNLWNINIPSCELSEYKGNAYAALSGHTQFPYRFKKFQVNNDEWYYFPKSEAVGALEENSDVDMVKKGYIAVTLLTVNLEDKESIAGIIGDELNGD
ncbi:5'/3'-nucleotidase SurE [Anaeromicropila herbilytica]|uniref:5'-nucleotidase SurE n=1 Tax=Anaeromicropila herbilytica TaxID=2785025 RepID=A0A7R7EJZ3_9FIRM|nr:5'/3'-nucleotidase SurE [Anaeromicropila herbilytica]BCN29852.1 5'-nucleotidase SurE [Anaeromicropila herbilytica]